MCVNLCVFISPFVLYSEMMYCCSCLEFILCSSDHSCPGLKLVFFCGFRPICVCKFSKLIQIVSETWYRVVQVQEMLRMYLSVPNIHKCRSLNVSVVNKLSRKCKCQRAGNHGSSHNRHPIVLITSFFLQNRSCEWKQMNL